jgi:gliding motility-associated-like protein
VNEILSAPFVDAGEDITLNCNQTTMEITAISSDDVEYLWTPPPGVQLPFDNVSSLNIDQPGLYIVMVTDTLTYCISSDSIEVFQSLEAPVSIVMVKHVTCFGADNGSISVQPEQGQGPFTFFLNGDNYGDTGIFTSLAPGLYSLEVLNSDGCKWITEVEITEPELLNVSIGADLFVQPGELITLEVQMNISPAQVDVIEWNPSEVINCTEDPCTSIRLSLFETTEIGVTVTDTNGCFASDQLLVSVIDNKKIFIPNVFSPNDDGSNDVFTLFAGTGVRMIRHLSVFTRWGELVFRKESFSPNDLSAGWDGTYRGKPLNPGLYVWRAEVEYQDGDEELLFGDVTLVR